MCPGSAAECSGAGEGRPAQQTTGQSREPLSDRLAQSDGVMCPPSNIDPQMHKDAPERGKNAGAFRRPAAPAAIRPCGRNSSRLAAPAAFA